MRNTFGEDLSMNIQDKLDKLARKLIPLLLSLLLLLALLPAGWAEEMTSAEAQTAAGEDAAAAEAADAEAGNLSRESTAGQTDW